MKTCSVGGCAKEAKASGFCWMHYKRNARKGTTEGTIRTRGTGTVTYFGYVAIAKGGKKIQEHRAIAEKALGRQLPGGAEIHHINGDRPDNRNSNLVICPSKAYHKLLHTRIDAIAARSEASYRKCPFCKSYDDPERMKESKHGRHFYHTACKAEYRRSKI